MREEIKTIHEILGGDDNLSIPNTNKKERDEKKWYSEQQNWMEVG